MIGGVLVACQSGSTPSHVATVQPLPAAPTVSASPATPSPPWPDARRIESADRSFSLFYPGTMFPKASAKGDAITLWSEVSEPSWGASHGPDIVFGIRLTKIHATPFAEMQTTLGKEAMSTIAPSGTEASFKASEGFVDKYESGYVIHMRIEGTGDVVHLFTSKDGTTWRFDCNYCCGMVGNAKMTDEQQFAVCDAVLATFENER